MKIVEKTDATGTLAEYATDINNGPVIVTEDGRPVAALIALDNADAETVALSTSPQFLALIERSRSRVVAEGGISSEAMRSRFEE